MECLQLESHQDSFEKATAAARDPFLHRCSGMANHYGGARVSETHLENDMIHRAQGAL